MSARFLFALSLLNTLSAVAIITLVGLTQTAINNFRDDRRPDNRRPILGDKDLVPFVAGWTYFAGAVTILVGLSIMVGMPWRMRSHGTVAASTYAFPQGQAEEKNLQGIRTRLFVPIVVAVASLALAMLWAVSFGVLYRNGVPVRLGADCRREEVLGRLSGNIVRACRYTKAFEILIPVEMGMWLISAIVAGIAHFKKSNHHTVANDDDDDDAN
ncbi:hypothetical protein GQ42DRAFT_153828 [Ramicandelaber brevisporus]|nr:hypothetical protein GQ42DRAFT_153828 [Ramicandelaber brevisporus]